MSTYILILPTAKAEKFWTKVRIQAAAKELDRLINPYKYRQWSRDEIPF